MFCQASTLDDCVCCVLTKVCTVKRYFWLVLYIPMLYHELTGMSDPWWGYAQEPFPPWGSEWCQNYHDQYGGRSVDQGCGARRGKVMYTWCLHCNKDTVLVQDLQSTVDLEIKKQPTWTLKYAYVIALNTQATKLTVMSIWYSPLGISVIPVSLYSPPTFTNRHAVLRPKCFPSATTNTRYIMAE